jgi:hypothetical protein
VSILTTFPKNSATLTLLNSSPISRVDLVLQHRRKLEEKKFGLKSFWDVMGNSPFSCFRRKYLRRYLCYTSNSYVHFAIL